MDTVSFALLAAVAQRLPGITLANALGLVEDFARFGGVEAKFDLTTHDGLVAYARTLPDVMEGIKAQKKIAAIKALRTAGQAYEPGRDANGLPYVGLKAAKDACDVLYKEVHGSPATYSLPSYASDNSYSSSESCGSSCTLCFPRYDEQPF